MLNIVKRAVFLVLLTYTLSVQGQQLPRFSQYYSNEFLVNPAVAGSDGRTVINLAAREQWVGFSEFSPNSYLLSVQGRILKSASDVKVRPGGNALKKQGKGRVGLGGIIYHDENGAIQRTGAQISYAYHLFVNNSQLSFGLTANVFQYRINRERAQLKDPENDPLNGLIGKSTLVPDAGVGVNYMTGKYHVGLGISHVFQSKLKIGNYYDFQSSDEIKILRHYFLIADYRYAIPGNEHWEVEPSAMVLVNEMFKMQSDVSLKAYYDRKYWFGISGRTSGDLVFMAGVRYDKYYLGYSYDYGFKGISRYTYGSHEICLTAKFGDTARRYRWLERY